MAKNSGAGKFLSQQGGKKMASAKAFPFGRPFFSVISQAFYILETGYLILREKLDSLGSQRAFRRPGV
ncbi:MAG: hypothetical protein II967_03405, partial [Deltaproteobacteria bacterium]|nr:hypothetical protein [Deltaproteobacteria bacterium]